MTPQGAPPCAVGACKANDRGSPRDTMGGAVAVGVGVIVGVDVGRGVLVERGVRVAVGEADEVAPAGRVPPAAVAADNASGVAVGLFSRSRQAASATISKKSVAVCNRPVRIVDSLYASDAGDAFGTFSDESPSALTRRHYTAACPS